MMEFINKGRAVPKWVRMFRQKYPKDPKVCSDDLPSWPKIWKTKGFIGCPESVPDTTAGYIASRHAPT